MSQKPISMEHLKQILQLKKDGVPIKEMARRTGISRNSIKKYLARLAATTESSSGCELAEAAYDNEEQEQQSKRLHQLMQFLRDQVKELSKVGVTRQTLWQEYLNIHPNGYGYSQFCFHLQSHLSQSDLAMHMEYTPADMMMADFAGKKFQFQDPVTREITACEVFVSILPFCGLIFCRAVPNQRTAALIECFNEMLFFYQGVPATILCDNFKTAVSRASKYEPQFTEMCEQLSEHYGTTFSATRPYSPRDKAMVEKAVNIVYNNVYGPLRNRALHNLRDINEAFKERLQLLNDKPYKNTGYSRWYFYEQQERKHLKILPPEYFTLRKVVFLTVQRNYHVQLSETHHYFSVPYQHVGKKVKVLYDHRSVEVYLDHERIALHLQQSRQKAYTTLSEHMPPHHQRMQEIKGWNQEDLLKKAGHIGEMTQQAVQLMLNNSIYMPQNYKACFGLLMLEKKYGRERLEAACKRVLTGARVNYTMVKNILEKGLDKSIALQTELQLPPSTLHENIRGSQHYQ